MAEIPEQYQTAGYRTVYSDADARQAIAIAEVTNKIGEGGGGGGITEEEVVSAIESASNLSGVLQEGTPVTGETLESGGASALGWLSSLRKSFTSGLKLLDAAGVIQATIKAALSQPVLTDTALVTTSRDKSAVEITGNASALNGDPIASIDVTGFQAFALQLSGTWSGQIQIQGSNDNFASVIEVVAFQRLSTSTLSINAVISSNGIYKGDINFKNLRVRITSYTSGTVNASLLLYKDVRNNNSISGITTTVGVTGSVNTTSNALPTVRTLTYLPGTVNTSGDNTIIAAPGSGTRIYVTALIIQLEGTTATTVLVKSGATNLKRVLCASQGDGISLQYSPGFELRLGSNEALILNLSGANVIGYSVEYYTAA